MDLSNPSGYVFLICAVFKSKAISHGKIWGYSDFKLTRSYKRNVIAGKGVHFDSSGFDYYLGNKVKCCIIKSSSIGQYVYEKGSIESKTILCKVNANNLE